MTFSLPRWFAHRGGGSLAPENTLAGIRLAASLGYKAVEFDVMLSGDGTPVLIHDETLERTTNGTGSVSDMPDSELFALDAGGGEPIPRFADAAALCRELGLLANIEIKPAAGYENQTAKLVAEMTKKYWHDADVQPLISSFSPFWFPYPCTRWVWGAKDTREVEIPCMPPPLVPRPKRIAGEG